MLTDMLIGAFVGFGLLVIVWALLPGRHGAVARVAHIDTLRARGTFGAAAPRPSSFKDRIGFEVSEFYARRGWEQRSIRSDLYVLERSWQQFLSTKLGLGLTGFLLGPFLFGVALVAGIHLTVLVPVWLALGLGALFFMLPDLEVRRDATAKRADLRRVLSAYLDLVSMNLAGGRGLPEALSSAAEISDGWALRRIRYCLTDARLAGIPQWTALARLGSDLGIKELTDLGTALALVADDGAKVRASLSARAETMRRRELTDMEGKAGARSQSMLVAQMLLCTGFMIFILFPAVLQITQF